MKASASRQASWGEKTALLVVKQVMVVIKQHGLLDYMDNLEKQILQVNTLQSSTRIL